MSEKKMVGRNVALTLGIICILLVGSLVALSVLMIEKDSTIQNDNNQINSLNSQLYNQTVIRNLMFLEVVFNQSVSVQAGQYIDVYDLTAANYSGFIDVNMKGLTNLSLTWIKVEWGVSSYGLIMQYNETKNFNEIRGSGFYPQYDYYAGYEDFPTVRYGYDNVTLGNNGNQTIEVLMTITYHY
jgi:hypothetical protein